MREGDQRWLLVASPDEELLTHVARDLQTDRELNGGEMPLRVEEVNALAPDVGEPGTRGILESGTGVLVRIPPWQRERYGIEANHGDSATFWRPEYTMEPFRKQVVANLDRKHGLFASEYLPGPSETDGELFNEYDLLKTYALPVDVTEGQRMTYVVSKWKLGYTVRDDDHRRHLNLALDCGIGERNSLGFGFLNITERTESSSRSLYWSSSVLAREVDARGQRERRVRQSHERHRHQKGKEQGGFDLDDHRIQYGLIRFHGLVDEHGAADTKLTAEDVERLDTLCWRALKNQTISRSKVGQEPRLYCRVEYGEESFHLGDLDKDLTLDEDASDPDEELRNVRDLAVDIDRFVERLDEASEQIERVRVVASDVLRFTHEGSELEGPELLYDALEAAVGEATVDEISVYEEHTETLPSNGDSDGE